MFVERQVSYSQFKQKKLCHLGGSWAKMTSPGGQQTVPACHPTKKVYKAVDPTHLPTKIDST
jgi:hypothetical protein